MAEVKQQSGNQVLDYMARDYDSLLDAMRKQIPEKIPEWTDYQSEADFGNALLELFAHMGDIVSYYQDRVANESFLSTAKERRSIIQHLKLISYTLSTAVPASTELKISVPESSAGNVVIRRGDAFSTKSTKEIPSVRFEYNGSDMTVDLAVFESEPGTDSKFYTIPVEEGRLIKDDIIGTSDGTAKQRFILNYSPLILRSIGESGEVNLDFSLHTELGSDIKVWTLQETLAFSREAQLDYIIEIDENEQATIVFGDNALGAIPATGSIIKATYRVGGGNKGNVAAGAIDTIDDAPALNLLGASVSNLQFATGGAERESIEHAVEHAPEVFRSFKRAVTANDYKVLALRFPGVGKVRAELVNWNKVTLYVAPNGGGRVSDLLTANLIAFFEDKRPLSTLIEVEDVDYVKIYIAARLGLKSYYSQLEMKEKVQRAVADLLAFENVDFGQTIYLSKIYEAIEAIEGVAYVTVSEFYREGNQLPVLHPEGRIELLASEIPRLPGGAVEDTENDMQYIAGLKLISIEGGY